MFMGYIKGKIDDCFGAPGEFMENQQLSLLDKTDPLTFALGKNILIAVIF